MRSGREREREREREKEGDQTTKDKAVKSLFPMDRKSEDDEKKCKKRQKISGEKKQKVL